MYYGLNSTDKVRRILVVIYIHISEDFLSPILLSFIRRILEERSEEDLVTLCLRYENRLNPNGSLPKM